MYEQEDAGKDAVAEAPASGVSSRRGGCGRGCLLVAVAILGSIFGALIASSFVPWTLGIPPWKLLDRAFVRNTLDNDASGVPPAIRTVISGETSEAPIVAVAAKVSPSVVYISTRQVRQDMLGQQTVEGEGSGVIYRSDGYIITNNHVVSGAQEIYVTIGDQEPMQGNVVGRDPEFDLAIVKVGKKGLSAAELGDSSKLTVGEVAVAVGAPFGLEKTVTSGVVSALHRNTVAQNEMGQTVTYANLIQTDAAINPGNSGGALADARGRVIGINTLIRSPSGVSAGIGFAIPISFVEKVAKQLMAKKKIGHAFIGVKLAQDSPQRPNGGGSGAEGAGVEEVVEGGPAAKAGIRKGDVIVRVGDSKIESSEDLLAVVRSHQPGDEVRVVYVRGKSESSVTVKLASLPAEQPRAGPQR